MTQHRGAASQGDSEMCSGRSVKPQAQLFDQEETHLSVQNSGINENGGLTACVLMFL